MLQSKCRIQPTADKVALAFEEVEERTKGGLIIPEKATQREMNRAYPAVVLAVGPGRYTKSSRSKDFAASRSRVPMQLKVGDRVAVKPLNMPILVDGREVFITYEDFIDGLL